MPGPSFCKVIGKWENKNLRKYKEKKKASAASAASAGSPRSRLIYSSGSASLGLERAWLIAEDETGLST